MSLNDVLLHIDSYPEATPSAAIDEAVAFVAVIGGTLSALAVEVDIPLRSNRVADYLIQLSDTVHEEEVKSRIACRLGLNHFKAAAQKAGVLGDVLHEKVDLYFLPDRVALRARTRDLCIVPQAGGFDGQVEVAETVLFGSGRPVLIFKAGASDLPSGPPSKVVVAWDGSRCAARALADALPILKLARQVRILTVVGEKSSAVAGLAADALRHLATHGITGEIDEVAADGRGIGAVFDAYLAQQSADLLVMGGYGHARLREMMLGGATQHMLDSPPIPVLMAH